MLHHQIVKSGALPVGAASEADIIDEALQAVREHLGMPVAYLSEFVGEDTVFRNVSAPGLEALIAPGDRRALSEVYCTHILSGDLPNLIPDTAAFPLARSLPITGDVPIGSHVSLPVHRSDGGVYGMFCALSPEPNPGLNERDLKVVALFARLAADQVRHRLERESDARLAAGRVRAALDARAFRMVHQPIYDLASGRLSSFEALCRFTPEPYRAPDVWVAEAEASGLGAELEMALARAALAELGALPAGTRMAVNLSPDTIVATDLARALAPCPAERVTIEITEHAAASDFAALLRAVAALRDAGITIAVDDVGAGYSGLQQIVRMRPDVLKLDRSLVEGIDGDAARRSLTTALVHFARETGARLVAEGVETPEEHRTLRALGVHLGQGWLFGRPGAIADARPRIAV